MLCPELCKGRYIMLYSVCLSVFLNSLFHFINTFWAVISRDAGTVSFSYVPVCCRYRTWVPSFHSSVYSLSKFSSAYEHRDYSLKQWTRHTWARPHYILESTKCGLFFFFLWTSIISLCTVQQPAEDDMIMHMPWLRKPKQRWLSNLTQIHKGRWSWTTGGQELKVPHPMLFW